MKTKLKLFVVSLIFLMLLMLAGFYNQNLTISATKNFNELQSDKTLFLNRPIHKSVRSATLPPSSGDWNITDTTIIENQNLIINGSILIKNGGTLILKNTKIYMNLEIAEQYGIEVFNGGNLTVINSLITAYNTTYPYFIKINDGGSILVDGSEISHVGYPLSTGGIYIHTKEKVVIRNSYIHDNYYGLWLISTSNAILENNTISNNDNHGIIVGYSTNIIIHNNTITDNYNSGIYLEDSINVSIRNNRVSDNYHGIYISASNVNVTIHNNEVVHHKHSGIYIRSDNVTVSNNLITHSEWYGIQVEYAQKGYFFNNDISNNNRSGIILMVSEDINITNNIFTDDHDFGVTISSSSRISVLNNTFNYCGLRVYGTAMMHFNHTIVNNTVNGKPLYYIFNQTDILIEGAVGQVVVAFSENIRIQNLNLIQASVGVYIEFSNDITIYNNNASLNNIGGIFIESSKNITIDSNFISGNTHGIYIYISNNVTVVNNIIYENYNGIVLHSSNNVSVFLNSFINNEYQAYDNRANRFDNGSIGNFWSDYAGTDTNGDGIGDTPYSIDSNSVDHYPIIRPLVVLETNSPQIVSVDRVPVYPTEEDIVSILVNVTDDTKVLRVILNYFNGTAWINATMVYDSATGYYKATIPALPAGTQVQYKIYAEDIYGNWIVSDVFTYTVKESSGVDSVFRNISLTYITAAVGIIVASLVVIYLKRRKIA